MTSVEEELLACLSSNFAYGWQVSKIIFEASNGLRDLPDGVLYPSLKRLESKGLIRSEWGESELGARRKYYRITDQGVSVLSDRIKFLNSLRRVR